MIGCVSNVVMSEPEFLNWKTYFKLLSDKRTPAKVKSALVVNANRDFIFSVEEIVLNLKVKCALFELCELLDKVAAFSTTRLHCQTSYKERSNSIHRC